MARYAQRLIREKIEVTSGTAVATTASDAVLAMNFTARHFEADYQQQNFVRGTEGAQGEDAYNIHAGAEYDVEAAPPVANGALLYAHLLRSSGMDMTDDDGDIVFTPTDPLKEIPSCTMQMRNGAIMQTVTGVRGGFSFTAENARRPFFRFNRRGRYVDPVAPVSEPHNFEAWPRALIANPENMFAFALGGTKLCATRFNFTDGRTPTVDKYMNCGGTSLSARRFTGAMTVKWPDLATKDLLTQIKKGITEPLVWTLGKEAGKTLTITAPKVLIKWAGEQDIEGDLGISLDLTMLPLNGNDDLEIRFS